MAAPSLKAPRYHLMFRAIALTLRARLRFASGLHSLPLIRDERP